MKGSLLKICLNLNLHNERILNSCLITIVKQREVRSDLTVCFLEIILAINLKQ